jgi:hypothetical protein
MSAEIVKLRTGHKVTAKRVAELSRQEKREKQAVIAARIAAALKGKGEGDPFERRVDRADVDLADAIEAAVARGMQTAFYELGAVLAAWAAGGAK